MVWDSFKDCNIYQSRGGTGTDMYRADTFFVQIIRGLFVGVFFSENLVSATKDKHRSFKDDLKMGGSILGQCKYVLTVHDLAGLYDLY